MKYFRLLDDVTAPGRWHLGEVTMSDGTEPEFIEGTRFDLVGSLAVPVTHPGQVLDFSLTSFAVPIATRTLANEVIATAGQDVECIPIEIAGQAGMVVLNALRVLRCLDES